MSRKVWLPVVGILIFVFVGWYLFRERFSPMHSLAADVDIVVNGNISMAEEELCEVLREFNHRAEDVELVGVNYLVEADGSEYVRADFSFSQAENLYDSIWKKASGKELEGIADMLITTGEAEAVIYRISCNYGYINRE